MVFDKYDKALKQILISDDSYTKYIIEFINEMPIDFVRQIQIGRQKSGYLNRNDVQYRYFINEQGDLAIDFISNGYLTKHYQMEIKHNDDKAFVEEQGNNAYIGTFYMLEHHNENYEFIDEDFEKSSTDHFIENHYEFYIIREKENQIEVVVNNNESQTFPAEETFSNFEKLSNRMLKKMEDKQFSM